MTKVRMNELIIVSLGVVHASLVYAGFANGEQRTKCGKVPPNEDMIKVVKPMAASVIHFLPIMEQNNVTMQELFDIIEEVCGAFEVCYPDGTINEKTADSPGGQCLIKAITAATTIKDTARATNVIQSLVESLPPKKKWFYAGMHWVVAMAEVD